MIDGAARTTWLGLVQEVPDWPAPGVTFLDLTPVLADPAAFAEVIDGLAAPFRGRVDVVAGIEARGFLFGTPVAQRLGVGFVPMRKAGKLPRRTRSAAYALEYGEAVLEVHADAFAPGARVLIVDDVLATGGTAAAATSLVSGAGAVPIAVAVLLEVVPLGGRATLLAASVGTEVHVLTD